MINSNEKEENKCPRCKGDVDIVRCLVYRKEYENGKWARTFLFQTSYRLECRDECGQIIDEWKKTNNKARKLREWKR